MLRRRKLETTTQQQSTGCQNWTVVHIKLSIRAHKSIFTFYPDVRFRMKCHLCVNYIEMQTDPATCDYVIVSGAQRKEERWDMAENEQILTTGKRPALLVRFHHCQVTNLFCWVSSVFEVLVNIWAAVFCLTFFCPFFKERLEKEKLETDAMFKLDHSGKDKEKLTNALPSLTMIQDYQSRWKDDFQLNSNLRTKFRVWLLCF